MGLSDLLSKVKKISEDETVKSVAKKVSSNKKVQEMVSKAKKTVDKAKVADKISKVEKSVGIDLKSVLSFAMKNQDIINILGKLGLKKKEDPASSTVQKLVGNLKTAINKASGVKVDDDSFSTIINKLLGNTTVKNKVEDIAGGGVTTFIKKAIKEFTS